MEKVSIIIPCKELDSMTIKCIRECLDLNYDDFEILVLPDYTDRKSKDERLNIIETGKVKPALKRNIGMKKAKGKFFAFIDSDAYPRRDWLKNAITYFEKYPEIGIVGGPNLTPSDANFAERVSGYALGNFLVTGTSSVRYKITKNQFIKSLPSCNYISRREISPKYDSNFLTAEDDKFCFDISDKDYKILYANDVIVYHHRRDDLWKHLKQMFIYGRDNIWLMKKEFSFEKLGFLITTLGVIGFLVGLILSISFPIIRNIFLIIVLIYLLIMLITSIHKNFKTSFYVFIISIITPFVHGVGSLWGLLTNPKKTPEVSWTSH